MKVYFVLVVKHATSSLSRKPNVIWEANRLCAVGVEWIVQRTCAIKKGGTAVIPSFYEDGFFVLCEGCDVFSIMNSPSVTLLI